MTVVRLTPLEIAWAAQAGVMRQCQDLRRNKPSIRGECQTAAWQRHIEGALSEYALAKHLNLHWSGQGASGAPDVGGRHEVRVTHRDNGRLLLYEYDCDDSPYWLLCGINGTYRVAGWILGVDGKLKKWWRKLREDRHPAYVVPQLALMASTTHRVDNQFIG